MPEAGASFYRLVGRGQLAHLDSILSIPALRGVRWIPGEGSPGVRNWPEVFSKIRSVGKLIQFFGDIDDLDVIAGQLGSAEGILLVSWETETPEDDILDALKRYGAA